MFFSNLLEWVGLTEQDQVEGGHDLTGASQLVFRNQGRDGALIVNPRSGYVSLWSPGVRMTSAS